MEVLFPVSLAARNNASCSCAITGFGLYGVTYSDWLGTPSFCCMYLICSSCVFKMKMRAGCISFSGPVEGGARRGALPGESPLALSPPSLTSEQNVPQYGFCGSTCHPSPCGFCRGYQPTLLNSVLSVSLNRGRNALVFIMHSGFSAGDGLGLMGRGSPVLPLVQVACPGLLQSPCALEPAFECWH